MYAPVQHPGVCSDLPSAYITDESKQSADNLPGHDIMRTYKYLVQARRSHDKPWREPELDI